MRDTDAFFTQTIVGAPMSVLLGRRVGHSGVSVDGVTVNLANGENQLSPGWREWILSSRAGEKVGQPRVRPGRVRRILERHAFWIALVGLSALIGTAAYWGLTQWI
jgi:hypothetical protein